MMMSSRFSRLLIVAAMLSIGGLLAACETPGRVGQTATFDIAKASPDDIAKALRQDGRVVLRGVLFETDSATLSEEGRSATARLGEVLQAHPNLKVAIVGHTDNTGDFEYNLGLSRRRADAMAASLVRSHRIAQNRVVAVGIGPLSPVAPNDTVEGRAQNRRVEVVLIN